MNENISPKMSERGAGARRRRHVIMRKAKRKILAKISITIMLWFIYLNFWRRMETLIWKKRKKKRQTASILLKSHCVCIHWNKAEQSEDLNK